MPRQRRTSDQQGIFFAETYRTAATIPLVAALAGNLFPVPKGPYGKLPYIYLVYLGAVLLWSFYHGRKDHNV